jgi:chromosome segregation ATPase
MKSLILRLLAAMGLAPASHVAQAQDRARRVAGKMARLEAQLARLRKDRDAAKQHHQQSKTAAADWKRSAGRAQEDALRARAAADRASAQVDEWRTRAEALTRELRELKDRLDESRRASTLAREHLMATEVKLDLIEAAIHVLDARTRETAVSRS